MLHPVVIQKQPDVPKEGDPMDEIENESIDNTSDRSGGNVKLVAVFEFVRTVSRSDHEEGQNDRGGFQEEDEEIVDSYSVWGEVALHYADLYFTVNRHKGLSGFLLTVVKYVFHFDFISLFIAHRILIFFVVNCYYPNSILTICFFEL